MNLQSDFISPATTNNNTSTTNATNNQAPSINISINNGIDSTASYLSGSLISTSRNNKSGANLTNLAANNNNSVSSYHSPLTISSLSSTSSSSSSSSSSPSAYIIPVNAALTSATTTSRPTYITINNLNNTSAINSVQPQQQLQRQQQQQLGTNNQQTTTTQSQSSSPCSSSVSYPSETPSNSSANYCMNSAVGSSSSSSSSSNNTNPVVGSLNSSSNNSNTANKLLAQQIVELLRRLNIRLVAFDFDYTIVTIHTGGQWLDSPEKLAEFVRPCFRDLLPVLLKTPDLNVCVVTYSPQERLIREVLRISLKDEHDVNDLVNKMVIKGNTKEFLERHGIEQCYANGKQVHIQYCRNHFLQQQQQQQSKNMVAALPNSNNVNKIDAANVLLIDDDIQNIHLASVNGHYAFPVENNMKLPDLYRFLKEQLESYI